MRKNTIRHRVKSHMEAKPGSKLENREVREALKMGARSANGALRDLANMGYLKRIKRGLYRYGGPAQIPLFRKETGENVHASM